jgi:putative NADH-flavin reductase
MSKILVLGAAGALGKHVTEQGVDAGHEVSVVVRTPSKLPAYLRDRVKVHHADIAASTLVQLGTLLDGHDAIINTAGRVSDGDRFVTLIAHIVGAIETIEAANRPLAWFIAGAGLLDIGDSRRRGLDLPLIKKTYWPHVENLKRLEESTLDYRLLCPGPMVEGAPVGLEKLRVGVDRLPVQTPATVKWLPEWLLAPLFVRRVPEMIVPYADAAALMLQNLEPGGAISRHRVGLALPVGMKGKKDRGTALAPTPKFNMRTSHEQDTRGSIRQ